MNGKPKLPFTMMEHNLSALPSHLSYIQDLERLLREGVSKHFALPEGRRRK